MDDKLNAKVKAHLESKEALLGKWTAIDVHPEFKKEFDREATLNKIKGLLSKSKLSLAKEEKGGSLFLIDSTTGKEKEEVIKVTGTSKSYKVFVNKGYPYADAGKIKDYLESGSSTPVNLAPAMKEKSPSLIPMLNWKKIEDVPTFIDPKVKSPESVEAQLDKAFSDKLTKSEKGKEVFWSNTKGKPVIKMNRSTKFLYINKKIKGYNKLEDALLRLSPTQKNVDKKVKMEAPEKGKPVEEKLPPIPEKKMKEETPPPIPKGAALIEKVKQKLAK